MQQTTNISSTFSKYCTGYCGFAFNGKENDNEVKGNGNQQDYGMRIYDNRSCRFLSVDPLTKSYPYLSTYAFAENDVIRCVDLDGGEKRVVISETNNDGTTTIVKDWDIKCITGSPGPLGNGTLYITGKHNTNLTNVKYHNFKYEGKLSEIKSFSYTVKTEDIPQLYDYDKVTPPPYRYESEVNVGFASSDKMKLLGYGYEKTYGIVGSFLKTDFNTDNSEGKLFNSVDARLGYSFLNDKMGASINYSTNFNNSSNVKGNINMLAYNFSVESSLINKDINISQDFKIFDITQVKLIGANISLTYNPTRKIIHGLNYDKLRGFNPVLLKMKGKL